MKLGIITDKDKEEYNKLIKDETVIERFASSNGKSFGYKGFEIDVRPLFEGQLECKLYRIAEINIMPGTDPWRIDGVDNVIRMDDVALRNIEDALKVAKRAIRDWLRWRRTY
jgi:hypothetical protein